MRPPSCVRKADPVGELLAASLILALCWWSVVQWQEEEMRQPPDEPKRLPPPPEAATDWCMCPHRHVAYLRPNGDSFCEVCGELFLNADFAATYGLKEAA